LTLTERPFWTIRPVVATPTDREKLAKVLALEQRQGCQDRAVIGGLEALLERLPASGAGNDGAALERARSRLAGYGGLAPAERARRVAAALSELDGELVRAQAAAGADPARANPSQEDPAPADLPPRLDDDPVPADLPPRLDDDPVLASPVRRMKGVGPRLAEALGRLGIHSLRDLLFHLPARYNDYRHLAPIQALRPGQEATITGTVWDLRTRKTARGRTVLTVILADSSGTVGCTFFNQPYLDKSFPQGARIVVSGRPELYQGRLVFRAPEWEPWDEDLVHTGRLVPVYPLTQGLSQRWLRAKAREAASAWAGGLGDPLPGALRDRHGLPSLPQAVTWLHQPADEAQVAAGRRRLAFDDLLAVGLWARQRRRERRSVPGPDLSAGEGARRSFGGSLPFTLTAAQARCLDEIGADLASGSPMTRLLQGDVGSGKTAVAAGAIVQCVASGYQAAIMAPTEILADQHLASLEALLGPSGYRRFDGAGTTAQPGGTLVSERREAGLAGAAAGEGPGAGPAPRWIARLVGSQKASERAATLAALRRGEVAVVVGTHALIQQHVAFDRLGLTVVDEQHRFGVLQRAELKARNIDGLDLPPPHQLIMTATPIPRTLALVLNADLDQSVLDEMPPGRKPVQTRRLRPDQRDAAYAFVARRVAAGEQAYIVYPLVEESEALELRAAVAEHARLAQEVFPDLNLGLLHGRLRPAEKEAVMAGFRAGRTQVLVATTVIEVGVDVPNATVMLIDGADRFGLAQLHQLRGRVGRGGAESVCLLLADEPSETAARRLDAMTRTQDGLALAELDLSLRGPGDYFGLRQAGVSDEFRFARLAGPEVLDLAGRAANEIMASDPGLQAPELHRVAARVAAFHAAAERV
jgi:ATP-dependent DNA helicase RecG